MKTMTIYVGNLPFSASEEEVRDLFEQFGPVKSVKLITDRETQKPRGFGFVEMDHDAAGQAIESLDGSDFGGRSLHVNEAREQKKKPAGGSYDRGPRPDPAGGNRRSF